MFFYSYTIELIFAALFAVFPSMLFLKLAGAQGTRKMRVALEQLVLLLILFGAQVLLYESILVNKSQVLDFSFLAQNLNLFVCLVAGASLVKTSLRTKVAWSLAWFLLLIFPGGFWTFRWLGGFIAWMSRVL